MLTADDCAALIQRAYGNANGCEIGAYWYRTALVLLCKAHPYTTCPTMLALQKEVDAQNAKSQLHTQQIV